LNTSTLPLGRVVAAHGRHCIVEAEDGERILCHPRGKKSQTVVGDLVFWQRSGDEGTVERVQARRNLFYRQDEVRTKSFAANIDQVLVLLAADPEFSESQLSRALVAAEAEGIAPLVVLNKLDLVEAHARAWQRLAPYREMGHEVLALGLQGGPEAEATVQALIERLGGRATLVLGPSGAGKSTLINRLVPHAGAQTGEVSRALNSGKHTTTSTTWYWMDSGRQTALIDSPGFQEFGLRHIEAPRLAGLMRDFAPLLGQCRFYNCTHLHEPGCAVRAVVNAPQPPRISPQRYTIYEMLFEELSASRY
jgi:ribosome biogenesis GTPase